jgi:sulfonate transport system ATP-binding protein
MAHDIHIDKISKSYEGNPVLGPIGLTLEAGTITAIIGRSGCGKTTLLRCLGGLEEATAGQITIGNGRLSRQDIGYVFQEPRLMPWLSAEQNTGFGLTGISKSARSQAVAEALQVVGLADAARLLPNQLSGGMAQRVALARALAPRPEVLFLDEPFSALDPFSREQMQDHLLHLHKYYGATMVLITHDMDEALALAHRIIVLVGPPGIVAGDLEPALSKPVDRSSVAFFEWKKRLTALLSGRAMDAEQDIPTNFARRRVAL